MKRLLIALLLLATPAAAQQMSVPLSQYFIELQASAVGVSNFVFTAPRKALYSLTVVAGASAGFVMVFDATELPADGAVEPKICWPVAIGGSISVQWMSPVLMTNGVVVGFSTGANCDTLTASATAKFMGQTI